METRKAIRCRKSVRSYTGEKVSEEELSAILEAAYAAPAGSGRYDTLLVTVIEDKELLSLIDEAGHQVFGDPFRHPLYGAPTLILVSVRPYEGGEPGNLEFSNAAGVVENMALAAVDLGVGCLHVWGPVYGINRQPAIRERLSLPEGFVPSAALIVGKTGYSYPERKIAARIRTMFIR